MPASALRRLRLTTTDGLELAADELAGGDPPLLFLHGLASNRVSDKSISLLAWARSRRRRLVRLDFRGHGESGGTLAKMTVSGLVADVEAALAHLGRAVVVGSSLGGMVAAWAASRHPDRVLGLVLIAPAFGFLQRMGSRPRRNGRLTIANAWVDVELDDDVLIDSAAWPEAELAARIRVPTLIVHGTDDEVVPVQASEQVFAGLACPNKELWLVDGGDHRLTAHIELIWQRMERLLHDAGPQTASRPG